MQGPQGPKGDTGATGPQGIQGPPGGNATGGSRAAGPCADNTNRFVDCGNGTVTDTLTGLIWLKNASCFSSLNSGVTYPQAVQAANALKDGTCGLTDGSVAGDWAVPGVQDFKSLFSLAPNACPGSLNMPAANGVSCFSTQPWADNIQPLYWTINGSNVNSFGIGTLSFSYAWQAVTGFNSFQPGDKSAAIGPSFPNSLWPVRGHVRQGP